MDHPALTETTYYILLSLYHPQHGYGIMQETQQLSGGRVRLAAGTLYGALNALCEKGWISPLPMESGSRKKEYQLTSAGLKVLKQELARLEELGFGGLPVCVAKTQYSLSDDPTKLGAPQDFILTVRKVKVSAGAGFIVALTGDILTMPGLPKTPAAEAIDVDENGVISGLF